MISQDSNETSVDFVTIVSGLPRSGTSMMMRMLEAGGMSAMTDNLRVADEDNPRGYYEFEPVKKTAEDASWLNDAPGKVVKMVYRLLYDLPADRHYRVVFMRREMDEILASQKKMLERSGRAENSPSDEEIAALFESQLKSFFEWEAAQSHIEMIQVKYNDLLSDPTAETQAIKEFLGISLDTDAMNQVVDPQLYRNRG